MDFLQQFLSKLTAMPWYWWLAIDVALIGAVGFTGAPLLLWTIVAAICLWSVGIGKIGWIIFAVIAVIFNIPWLRRYLVTMVILKLFRALKLLPKISTTERTALDAGNVWAEVELFSGRPNFKRLLAENYPRLTEEEQAFIDGPVEEICHAANDWQTWQKRDLSPEVWNLLKKHKLFGMIIPKKYGGLGFSALAHSEVIMKFQSRSLPLCITAMVPNSLGPAELLIHYGTDEQKNYYLPRLAGGEEMPCFALTEPTAGSDAGAITATGVVFKGEDGKPYIRLNWNKRYITLAAVSTVLGLAFKLKDPDNILGEGQSSGITCALIPTKTEGITVNERHDPMGVPFHNSPIQGKDVVIPIDYVFGGLDGIGQGWQMLMECLAAGRGISLPAQSTGGAKIGYRVTSAYASIREQFGVSIGKFEGIVEPLARIAGLNYLLEAARIYTLGAIDNGVKPPVVTAIMKYHFTEIGRRIINDAMDIVGGAGISLGPRNMLAHTYIATPIGITVEGANILTRTLIIFGQGALRAHPYAYQEVAAVENNDLAKFDRSFWGHIGHVMRNTFRSVLLSVTRGRLSIVPGDRHTSRYYKKLAWASATFAIMTDIAMGTLGGKLKFKEKLTGRFADVLSWMYLGTAVLRRYEADGRNKEDLPFVHWSMQYALYQIQVAFENIFRNFDAPVIGLLFKGPLHWWCRLNSLSSLPADHLDNQIAELMQTPGEQRQRLTANIYMPQDEHFTHLEKTFELVHYSMAIAKKVKKAVRQRLLPKMPAHELYEAALAKEVITREELELMQKVEKARYDAVQVDSFTLAAYKNRGNGHNDGNGHNS